MPKPNKKTHPQLFLLRKHGRILEAGSPAEIFAQLESNEALFVVAELEDDEKEPNDSELWTGHVENELDMEAIRTGMRWSHEKYIKTWYAIDKRHLPALNDPS
jgi:hypothetical protein